MSDMITPVKPKKKRNKKRLFVFVSVVVIVLIVAGISFYAQIDNYGSGYFGPGYKNLESLNKYSATANGIYFDVKKGNGLRSIAKELKSIGFINNSLIFEIVGKKNGYSSRIKQGVFFLKWGDSYKNMLDALSGDPVKIKVVIPENFDFRHTAKRLEEKGLVNAEDFINYANTASFGFWFESTIPNGRNPKFEGYTFPATYSFEIKSSRQAILKQFLNAFNMNFSSQMKQKCSQIGMTPDQVITLASVVEREGGNRSEYKRVAGVFMNRLKIGMKLQSCATLKYIFENDNNPDTVAKDVFTNADTLTNSPYNTYMNAGLPPGPICSPGLDAINAVLNYEKNDYLYFVATGQGTNYFSRTLAEHNAAKAKYLG